MSPIGSTGDAVRTKPLILSLNWVFRWQESKLRLVRPAVFTRAD